MKYTNPLIFFARTVELLNKHNVEYFIAGGSVSSIYFSKKYNIKPLDNTQDIDIYFEKEAEFKKAKSIFNTILKKELNDEFVKTDIYETDNAITYYLNDGKVQLIKKYFLPLQEILQSFDLNISKIAYKNGIFIGNKELKLLKIDYINSLSLLRFCKYTERGYNYDLDNFKKTVKSIWDENKLYESYYRNEQVTGRMMIIQMLSTNKYESITAEIIKMFDTDLEFFQFIQNHTIFTSGYFNKLTDNCYMLRLSKVLEYLKTPYVSEREKFEKAYQECITKNPELFI